MKFIQIFFLALIILVSFMPMAQALAFPALVNCGKDATPCTLADFWQLLARVVKFLTAYIGIPLAVLGIGVGGFHIIIARGSPGEITKGREIIVASVVGLFIALAAFLIVNTILKGLGANPNNITNPLKNKI
ncbi:MAG TPA: hypothetical protein VJG48_02420 [Candidatus Paceibacterota bacterium]